MILLPRLLAAVLLCVLVWGTAPAQTPAPVYPSDTPKNPDPIEKLGNNLFRLGSVRVDTAKREVTIPGKVNNAMALEFIANTKNGFKAYESAFEMETNGLTFNLAMILIGLDKTHAKPSRAHFDPNPPEGDPVEIWLEWKSGTGTQRIRAEELLWDSEKQEGFGRGSWVYTGSTVLDDGRYMADLDGVLIGFVHDPASIIEWSGAAGVGRFGFMKINPKLGLEPETRVTVTVKAAGAASRN